MQKSYVKKPKPTTKGSICFLRPLAAQGQRGVMLCKTDVKQKQPKSSKSWPQSVTSKQSSVGTYRRNRPGLGCLGRDLRLRGGTATPAALKGRPGPMLAPLWPPRVLQPPLLDGSNGAPHPGCVNGEERSLRNMAAAAGRRCTA